MTRFSVEFTYCSLDDKPIEISPAYRALLLCGEEIANFFTYCRTIDFPIPLEHPPPESEQHEPSNLAG